MAEFPLPGVKYHIINEKSGTLMDLSGTNQTTISGWQNNGGANQEWYVEDDPSKPYLFVLKNVKYGKFAYFTGGLREGAPLVGVEEASAWELREVEPYRFKFFIPGTPYTFELSKDGDKANGTPVVLAEDRPVKQQNWKFVPVA